MAIIICTECGHDVSDKAEFCPGCGYSIKNILNDLENKVLCKINGRDVDITDLKNELNKLSEEDLSDYKYFYQDNGISMKTIKMLEKGDERFNNNFNNSCELQRRYYPIFDLTPQAMDEFLCMFIDNNLEPFDFDGDSFQAWQNRQKAKDACRPRCPMCGSTNIQKISDFSRASSILGFGILSKKIGKQWQCNNPKCKHLW